MVAGVRIRLRGANFRPSVIGMTKTFARVGVTAVALLAPLLTVTAPADAAAPTFRSCDALTRVWPNGVAKSATAARRAVRDGHSRPAYGTRARAVYWQNYRNLDRDRDGTACEN